MSPVEQEAFDNFQILSTYFASIANMGAQGQGSFTYFPDVASQFSSANTLASVYQVSENSTGFALGHRVDFVNFVAATVRESTMRAHSKAGYGNQQQYVAGNDAGFYDFRSYNSVYNFGQRPAS